MPLPQPTSIFWFRRDLRLTDNVGLHHALTSTKSVLPLFIFDREILDKLDDKDDPRVTFIHQELLKLKAQLADWGSDIIIRYGKPKEIWPALLSEFPSIKAVYTNHDYEPYAIEREAAVGTILNASGVQLHTFKDQVIFERREILSGAGTPLSVFTPYARRWRDQFQEDMIAPTEIEPFKAHFCPIADALPVPSLASMGFTKNRLHFPPATVAASTLQHYGERRDLPAIEGTSRLSLHLRFGTISVRQAVRMGRANSDKWLSELIWREFYMQVLSNNPRIVTQSFRPEYDNIAWRNNPEEFEAWCTGNTGYPLVDAGMRQLNTTYWMHNRVRMVVASFLSKHLLIDWRWGEAYFAKKLIDFELASNNGGWQWASGSGTDAAPYFRVFNPTLQWQKFDPKSEYVRHFVPEFQAITYRPIVDHDFARKRALDVYGATLKKSA